jgi:hypothetical protein
VARTWACPGARRLNAGGEAMATGGEKPVSCGGCARLVSGAHRGTTGPSRRRCCGRGPLDVGVARARAKPRTCNARRGSAVGRDADELPAMAGVAVDDGGARARRIAIAPLGRAKAAVAAPSNRRVQSGLTLRAMAGSSAPLPREGAPCPLRRGSRAATRANGRGRAHGLTRPAMPRLAS